MNLITISASTIIQQSDFLIEGHKIKKRIAVDTVANKIPLTTTISPRFSRRNYISEQECSETS